MRLVELEGELGLYMTDHTAGRNYFRPQRLSLPFLREEGKAGNPMHLSIPTSSFSSESLPGIFSLLEPGDLD